MSNRLFNPVAIAAALCALSLNLVHAQSLEMLSPQDRQKALQALQGGSIESSDEPAAQATSAGSGTKKSGAVNETKIQTPIAAEVKPADGELPLFGYALFSGMGNAFQPSAEVPIPQNYVLGPGDLVRVQLFGNQNETLNLSVTRDGAINFPKLGPIQVAGLTVDDARAVIDRRVAKELIGVQTNITLGPLRGMQIFLLGDARQPGAYSVSGLATMTQALIAGGGISPTGSLRKIELKRAGRVMQRLDLYDFLLRGDSARDTRLQAGDAVFIPPVGPRVTIAGAVTRPAIYEMAGVLTIKGALDLAGGLSGNARRAQATLERIGADGQRQLRSLDVRDESALSMTLKDGDRLDISALYERAENPVSVIGHVRYEKSFAWNPQLTLGKVLSQAEVRPSEPGRELYPILALIEKTDRATGLRYWHGFDLALVQSGVADEPVEALDRIVVLTRSDINYLLAPEVRAALSGALPKPTTEFAASESTALKINPEISAGSMGRKADNTAMPKPTQFESTEPCPGLVEVVKMADSARAISIRVLLEGQASAAENRFGQAGKAALNRLGEAGEQTAIAACPSVFRAAPTALPYLLENSTGLVGEVRNPGLYPFVSGAPLSRLTAMAGGETREANAGEVEFFDVNETLLGASAQFRRLRRDAILAEQPVAKAIYKFLPAKALPEVGAINVRGEVRFPGRYVIARGERYSELLARAGGLNENAFAYGTVFTRASARSQEEAANRRVAADLRESLVNAATLGISPQNASATANTAVLDLVQRLESATPVGRVVIEADPSVLVGRAGADFLLEPNDEIFIPKRPNFVAVTGQVLSPGSLAFTSGASPEHYIKQAGGYADAADSGRSFLVLPNGEARPLQQSFWKYQRESIPPGSVIVVPRDVSPFTGLLLTERITSILSNLALSAAALVTINR